MAEPQKNPQKIGKYSILERIGRGGMGYVYKAHDPILKRDVAIKTMLKDVADDEELRNRFLREAQSAGGLRHPNVVTIYDLGEDENGCPFIAMEFLSGTDLEHLIKNKVDMPLLKKLDIMIQTCHGLGYAHANGIVHRDIKTANIRLLDNGEAKIMDFGIAKMTASHFTRTGMIMGTPHYMAPEQIRGEKVDGRADIFSLGVVLYELLVYRKPFAGDNPTTVLFKIIHEQPEPLVDSTFTPPEGLADVVMKAIAKKPEERYQTCEELAEDLRYIYAFVQQQQYETGQVSGGTGRQSRTPTPVPTIRRGPGTGAPTSFGAGTPMPGTPMPATQMPSTKTGFTLPSQQKAAMTQQNNLSTGAMPAAETYIQSPTQATIAQPGSGRAETVIDPALAQRRADLPPITPTPIPSTSKIWWVAATSGVLGVAVIVALMAGVLGGKKEVIVPGPDINKPPIDKTVPVKPEVTPAEGWLTVNVQPWAEITSIKDQKGQDMPVAAVMTPCRVQLPPGTYTVILRNPQFETRTVQVEIKSQQTTVIQETLKGFDYARAVESLGF